VNPARIDGGGANNVVPDHAVLRFNIRPKTIAAAEAFSRHLNDLLRSIAAAHDVAISPHGGVTRPPKPVDARAQRLFELAQASEAALGRAVGWRPSGGACDGNNIAAAGVPVVDTMGVRGGAIHSAEEYLIVPSLAERAQLSALVLHRLATAGLE
jgi:glutamate carboxypeptidase